MDTLLDGKITEEDIEFADWAINRLLKRHKVGISKESAFAITDLHSDYKHKNAAFRLSEKKGDLMWQKHIQYEERIDERVKRLFKETP
jgi:hypothetical protein